MTNDSVAYRRLMVEVGHMSKRQSTAVFDYVDELRDEIKRLSGLLETVSESRQRLLDKELARHAHEP